jgi:hypothetical protein
LEYLFDRNPPNLPLAIFLKTTLSLGYPEFFYLFFRRLFQAKEDLCGQLPPLVEAEFTQNSHGFFDSLRYRSILLYKINFYRIYFKS